MRAFEITEESFRRNFTNLNSLQTPAFREYVFWVEYFLLKSEFLKRNRTTVLRERKDDKDNKAFKSSMYLGT